MPPVVAFLTAVGSFATFGAAAGATAAVIGAAAIVGGVFAASKLLKPKINFSVDDNDRSRQTTVRSTTEPRKLIYGETMVSGPLTYAQVSGAYNKYLHQVVALAGHELTQISKVFLDDKSIDLTNASIYNSGSKSVISGFFGPKNNESGVSETVVYIDTRLGTSSQTAYSGLRADSTTSTEYLATHRGDNVASLYTRWTINEGSREVWDEVGSVQNIKALVKGKKIYDPRLEVDAGGTAGASPTNASYVVYDDNSLSTGAIDRGEQGRNPALMIADYLMDSEFGLGIPSSKIDWAAIIAAADDCDTLVPIPNSATQKRFFGSGVIFGADPYAKSIEKILSGMNGSLVYSQGKYIVRAGVFFAPTESITEDDIIGAVDIRTAIPRSDRLNQIKGLFIDPTEQYKMMEFGPVTVSGAIARDNGETLEEEIKLPFTDNRYAAQRIAFKQVNQSFLQTMITVPVNLKGMRIAVGDRVNVYLSDLESVDAGEWNPKIFKCINWSFAENGSGGINLTLLEDVEGRYADPLPTDYSTITAQGVIARNLPDVPAPTNFGITAAINSIELAWDNPSNALAWEQIWVFRNTTGTTPTDSDTPIVKFRGTSYTDQRAADGTEYYYWIQAVRYPQGSTPSSGANASKSVMVASTPVKIAATKIGNAVMGTDSIDTAQIIDEAIGSEKIATTIQSDNWATSGGADGWQINRDGSATFQTATIQGGITATSGTIGGTTITSTNLNQYSGSGTASHGDADTDFWLDDSGNFSLKDKFVWTGGSTNTLVVDGSGTFSGAITAESLTVDEANITGTLTLGGGILQDGDGNNLTQQTTLNAQQIMSEVTGVISENQHAIPSFWRITTDDNQAPSNSEFNTAAGRLPKVNDLVITTDTTTTPDTTYGWTCTTAGVADPATEANWTEITNFISGDLLVDGSITADQIAANEISTTQLTVGVGTSLGLADTASQVNAGLALLLNKDTYGNAKNGEASLVSVDKNGNPVVEDASTTSNGFIQWNGSKITVEAAQFTGSATVKYTVLTGLAGKRGFIVFDTTKSTPFTVGAQSIDVAFAYKEGDQWYYDNNVSATAFTPTNDMVALGYLETGTADLILKGGLINPVTLTAAAFPSDEIKSGSIGGINIDGSKIYSGTGTWGNTNTGFYLDNTGKFSLKDALTFDPATASLQVVGSIETDVLTVNDQFNLFGNTFFAHGVKDGAITADMLANSAINLLQGSLAQSVGGSNGDFKEDTGTFSTSGGSIVLGTVGDLFDHGELAIEMEANFSISWNSTTNYGTQNFTLQFQVSTDGTNYTNVGTGHTITISTYDLSSYYPGNYYVHYSYTDITESISAASLTNNTDYYIRALISNVPTSVTGQTPSFTFSANEGVTGVTSTGGNADTLDNLDSTAFLRSNVDDTFDANLTITGNLTVQGTTTTVDTDNLTVKDNNITLNYSTGDSTSTADNAGITIQDAVDATTDASILWKTASDKFEFSHGITAPSISGYAGSLYYEDNRTIAPSELSKNQLRFGFTSWGNNDTTPYADFLHMRSYQDSTGGSDNLVMFKKSGIGMRIWQQTYGSTTAYSIYEDVWHTGNLTTTNKTNYDTAYTYSQVGHLPLAGGTLTGQVTISYGAPVLILNDSDASTPTEQVGYISFQRQNSEKAWIGYGGASNDDFTIRNTEGPVTLSGGAEVVSGGLTVSNSLRTGASGIFGNMSNDWQAANALRGGNFSADIGNDTTVLKLFPASINDESSNIRAAGDYSAGIGFMHLDPNNSSWGTTFTGAQAWVGLKLEDTAGQERSSFVIATNPSTTAGTMPVERLSINKDGLVSIGNTLTITGAGTGLSAINMGSETQTLYTNLIWYAEGGNAQIYRGSSTYENWGGENALNIYNSNGNISFHPSATNGVLTLTSLGGFFDKPVEIRGAGQASSDATLLVTATSNNDWGIIVDKWNNDATEYGIDIRVADTASYALRVLGSGAEKFRVDGAGNTNATGIFATSSNQWGQFTGSGSATYTQGAGYCSSSEFSFEAPLTTDAVNGAHVPIYLTWRGGYGTQGGIKITDDLTEISGNLSVGSDIRMAGTTVIDSSRNLTNIGTISSGAITSSGLVNWTGMSTSYVRDALQLNATDDRDIAPEDLTYADDLRFFFTEKNGVEGGSIGATYLDFLYMNSYKDSSGGDANALGFHKGTRRIYHYQADQSATNWGTPKELAYTDDNITGTAAGLSGSPNITVSNVYLASAGAIYFNGSTSSADGNYGIYTNAGYFDTLNSGVDTDPLELVYSRGSHVRVGTGTWGSKEIRASIGVFTAASDYQLHLRGTDTWAGIRFEDNTDTTGRADYIWYNGENKTFALGGGGSNVANKKLHVDGGMTVGSGYDATSVLANQIRSEGGLESGNAIQIQYTGNGNNGADACFTIIHDASDWKIKTQGKISTTYYDYGYINEGAGSYAYYQTNAGTPAVRIDYSGNAIFAGNVTAYGSPSDIRLKENIHVIENALDKVTKLQGVTFNYKKDGSRSTGLIAQQLLEVLPEAVYEQEELNPEDEKFYAVRYGNTVGLLVEAIKELKGQIQFLTKRIKELENANN